MKQIVFAAITMSLLCAPLLARAHEGELDAYGCHKGQNSGYHCHKGDFVGWYFASQEDMLSVMHKREAKAAQATAPADAAQAAVSAKDKAKDKEVVKQVQEKLREKGYYHSGIDGSVGPRTRAALKAFQKDQGLKASAQLDSETLGRLGMN